jgi:hypothetical protein
MTRFTLLSRLGLVLLVGATITCSNNEPNPPPPEAAALAMAGGNSQSAPAGQPLANPIGVRVTDDNGEPVADVTVNWDANNGGSVSASTTTTDEDGRTTVTWTLGPTAGSQTAVAAVDGLDGSPVQFTATAVEVGEITLTITQQPPASALTAEVFAPDVQPAVRLLDADGAPMAGAAVTASVQSGGGDLQGTTTATTDANGVAAFADLGIDGDGAQVIGFSAAGASADANAVDLQPLPPEATTGEWDASVDWDIVPLHMSLLPSGKILAWGRNERDGSMGQPRLWDPTSGTPAAAIHVDADTMLFCAGHALMADGNLMVSGGHKLDDRGLDVTHIFDWQTEQWNSSPLPKMAKGRWYPTVTTLPDGRLVTVAGKDTSKKVVTIPEVWENNQWVQLPGASLTLPYYPRDFVDPETGLVFMAGERVQSRWLDVDASGASGRGRWDAGPSHIWGFNRDYGSAVMYDTGKILYVGGGGNTGWDTPDRTSPVPTATAEKIDLMAAGPSWAPAGSMAQPRRHLNATVLPDGTVLVTGGVSGGGFNDLTTAVHTAELWDPAKPNDWTALAPNAIDRGYHSVSLLLPDGTVLHGASGDADVPGTTTPFPAQRNHEIFHPPYLFRGARPVITSAPGTVTNGSAFQVATPNAAQVTSVRWIHLGAVTHAFDQSARANTLTFTQQGGGLSVTAPSDANSAPPGYYMLFILNRNGVPSVGKIIHVQ